LNKVDIVLALYNGEKFLKEQLNSLYNQTYKNFNLIIIDDSSQDRSSLIIEEFQKKYNNIRYVRNDINMGHVKSFEKGLQLSTNNFIAFCDQDDIWEKNKLELQVNILKNYKNIPALVHSDLSMINENGDTIGDSYFKFRNYILSEKKELNKIISQNGIMGNTLMINKQLKELVLPFPRDVIVHDYWIAVINEIFGKRITLKNKLVRYRIHDSNSSNSKSNIFNNDSKFSKRLPYRNIKREKVLEELLKKYDIPYGDKKIIKIFLEYLYFNKNRFKIYFNLIKYDMLKQNFLYRVKILFKMLWQ